MWFVWAPASPAQAYEDLTSLDAEFSYAHAFADEAPRHGAALGLGASLGLDEVLSVRGQFAWALHPDTAGNLSVLLLSAELLYLIDVLEIVPYFGAGVDGLGTWAAGESIQADFGVHPVLGFDWLLSREFALGIQLRPVFVLTQLDAWPVYFKAGVSVSYFFEL